MLQLKITKKFLDNYRQYKIDRVNNIAPPDILYVVLEHLLNSGKTMSYLYDLLGDSHSFYIDIINGDISDRKSNNKSYDKNITVNSKGIAIRRNKQKNKFFK